ncbi:MAG: sulfatase family protein, partial [Planctomycetota bacterium]
LEKTIEYGGVKRYPYIENVAAEKRKYYGTVTQLDAAFGQLMRELEKRNLADNTFVIFTSDNGPEFPGGSTRLDLGRNTAWGTPGKLRGVKRHLYEGGIRVPGIMRWPKRIKAGQTSNEPISSVDFLPTFCKLSGAKIPTDLTLDGVNIMPIFQGKSLKRTRPLCWNINYTGVPNMAMRVGDEVLLGFAAEPTAGQSLIEWIQTTRLQRFELYNLKTDLTQKIDLSRQKSKHFNELVSRMKQIWQELQNQGPKWPKGGRIKPAVGKVWQSR